MINKHYVGDTIYLFVNQETFSLTFGEIGTELSPRRLLSLACLKPNRLHLHILLHFTLSTTPLDLPPCYCNNHCSHLESLQNKAHQYWVQ